MKSYINYKNPDFSCLGSNINLVPGSRPYEIFDDILKSDKHCKYNTPKNNVGLEFNFSCNRGFITFIFTFENPNLYKIGPKDIYLAVFVSLDFPERSRISTVWPEPNNIHNISGQLFPPITSDKVNGVELNGNNSPASEKLITAYGKMSLYFDRIYTVVLSSLPLKNTNLNLIDNPSRFSAYFFNVNNLNVESDHLSRIGRVRYLTLIDYSPDNFSKVTPRLLPNSPVIEYSSNYKKPTNNPLNNFITYCIPSAQSSCCFALCNWCDIPPTNSNGRVIPIKGSMPVLVDYPVSSYKTSSTDIWPWWDWVLVVGGIIILILLFIFSILYL